MPDSSAPIYICPTCGGPLPHDDQLRIDPEGGFLLRGGSLVRLKPVEFTLFEQLWRARPRHVEREQLHEGIIWRRFGAKREPQLKLIDVLVCKMRPRLKEVGIKIETVWGRGFRAKLIVEKQT